MDSLFRKYGRLETYSKKEVILQSSQAPTELYRIQSGFVKSYDITPQGSCSLLFIYQPNEVFPLYWVQGHESDGLFYEAMTYAEVHAIPKDVVMRLLRNNSEFFSAASEQLMSLLYRYTNRIKNLEYRTARERVMFRLLELVERFGLESSSGIVINAPITHQDIADSINVTRETTSREIQRLIQTGLLGQNNHLLIIRDIKRLSEEFL